MTTGRPAGAGAAPNTLQAALPKPWYVDDAHWLREREAVIYGSWLCVGRVDELGLAEPGRLAVLDVAGESILLTSDADRTLHAAYNVCRHRGSQVVPVAGGETECRPAQALRCPYHSWTYDLSGRLLRAPHTEGVDGFDHDAFGLSPVAVADWRGFCFVHLTPSRSTDLAADLADFTARLARYPLESLVVGRRFDYDVAANYKLLLENFNECYHCGPVHPELTRLVPAFGSGGAGLDWDAGVPHREDAWTFTMTGTTTRAPFPDLDDNERSRHKGELVYPNLMLSCSADHVAAVVLWPTAADRTRVTCELLFAPDEVARGGFDPDDAGELWDLVNRQDWAVCESVQRGMSSRAYRQGWFAPMEDWSADIRRWLVPRVEEFDG
ncbi:MAG TPA: aromatic ring-hydroxylating dioxygenase subunit alpha [Nocardioidaceae bacterium]|nr:aromatic ring-hydroxylating dioxygenase subunit alpha [Nocardioidaceae bacterium]